MTFRHGFSFDILVNLCEHPPLRFGLHPRLRRAAGHWSQEHRALLPCCLCYATNTTLASFFGGVIQTTPWALRFVVLPPTVAPDSSLTLARSTSNDRITTKARTTNHSVKALRRSSPTARNPLVPLFRPAAQERNGGGLLRCVCLARAACSVALRCGALARHTHLRAIGRLFAPPSTVALFRALGSTTALANPCLPIGRQGER